MQYSKESKISEAQWETFSEHIKKIHIHTHTPTINTQIKCSVMYLLARNTSIAEEK